MKYIILDTSNKDVLALSEKEVVTNTGCIGATI
jgi:hypothetical protein